MNRVGETKIKPGDRVVLLRDRRPGSRCEPATVARVKRVTRNGKIVIHDIRGIPWTIFGPDGRQEQVCRGELPRRITSPDDPTLAPTELATVLLAMAMDALKNRYDHGLPGIEEHNAALRSLVSTIVPRGDTVGGWSP